MDILFFIVAAYGLCGALYSAVAVSNFKCNTANWDKDGVKGLFLIAFFTMLAVFWPLFLYDDIKSIKE